MTTFRDTEMHLSQIPALHLLQALGYRMLTKTDVDKRRDQIAKRMLNTPPKPHKDSIKGSRGTTKKGGGHKDRRQS